MICKGCPIAELTHEGKTYDLPKTFEWNGKKIDTEEYLTSHATTGLIVLKIEDETKARVLYEKYSLGSDRNSFHISWSVGKSILSAAIGIAISEGILSEDLDVPVSAYVPELKETAWTGVSLRNVLTMSSGVYFNEDYANALADINVMGYYLAMGWSIDDFVMRFRRRGHEQGAKSLSRSKRNNVLY